MPFLTRTSPRHPTYNYSSVGAYFITICTLDKQPYLSNIIDGKVHLTSAGKIVRQNIDAITDHFPHVLIDTYVIMPNHVHMIVCMKHVHNPDIIRVDDGLNSRTPHGVSLPDPLCTDPSHRNPFGKMHRNSLSLKINQFK